MVVHQAYVLLILVVHQPSIVAPSWSRQSSAQEEVRVNVRRLPVGSASRSSWKEDAVGGRKTQRVAALHSHSLLRSAGVGKGYKVCRSKSHHHKRHQTSQE